MLGDCNAILVCVFLCGHGRCTHNMGLPRVSRLTIIVVNALSPHPLPPPSLPPLSPSPLSLSPLSGHKAVTTHLSAVVSPCGRFLLCPSEDSNVYVYTLPPSLTPPPTLKQKTHESFSCPAVSAVAVWTPQQFPAALHAAAAASMPAAPATTTTGITTATGAGAGAGAGASAGAGDSREGDRESAHAGRRSQGTSSAPGTELLASRDVEPPGVAAASAAAAPTGSAEIIPGALARSHTEERGASRGLQHTASRGVDDGFQLSHSVHTYTPTVTASAATTTATREKPSSWMFRRGGSKAQGSVKGGQGESNPLLVSPSIDPTPSDAPAHQPARRDESNTTAGGRGSEGGNWKGGKGGASLLQEFPSAKGYVFVAVTYCGEIRVYQNMAHPVKL